MKNVADEAKPNNPPQQVETKEVEILEEVPASLQRPLSLIDGRAYAATWVPVRTTTRRMSPQQENSDQPVEPPSVSDEIALVIVRDDGQVFADAAITGARPLTHLEVTIKLREPPPANRSWSGAGVNRFLSGERPNPADVFRRVGQVVDRFMDFNRSLADQRTMCELNACFVLATYFLDGFNVIGYLWPNGDRGTGKTRLLHVICEQAYLGMVVLAGGTYATLRDMADYGATLAFDDCENIMDAKRVDPDKRALMLAGNRRGTVIPLKEPKGQREWVTRQVHAYSARLFSAIGLPDDVLGSRAITVPLVRSLDDHKAKIDPLDHAAWPHHRQQLIDDLWATGLCNLLTVHEYDAKAADRARLIGRDLDPWRGILAVALWLEEECGVAGLFERMETLSVRYQDERGDLEAGDDTRLLILALRDMLGENEELEFETSVLCKAMNQLAQKAELAGQWEEYTNPKRVGRLLQRLRFTKAQRTSEHKRWKITRDELSGLSRSYGLEVRSHKENGTNGIMAPSGVPRCQECQVPGDNESPEAARLNQAVATVEQGLEALKEALRTATPVA